MMSNGLGSAEQVKLMMIRAGIDVLETAFHAFEAKIGAPLFIAEEGYPRFKYIFSSPEQAGTIFQVMKTARVISGLDAATVLLERGHVTEIAVLIRTIDDFLGDIVFIGEALDKGTWTAGQQRTIDLFFAQEKVSVEEMIAAGGKQPPRVSQREVRAAEARVLSEDADSVQRIAATIDNAYSMYVHGEYPSIMEMYEGGDREGYRLRGMLGTPKIAVHRHSITIYTHRSLNVFAGVAALTFKLRDLFETLVNARRVLEASPAYQD